MKTVHGHTNFNKLYDKLSSLHTKVFRRMDIYIEITPLSDFEFRIRRKNDVIDFFADYDNEVLVPLHLTNILDDLDYNTFVTGTDICKRHLMVQADERLYVMLKDAHIWSPVE